MRHSNNLPNDPEWAHLVQLEIENIRRLFPINPERWIIVDTETQRLTLHYQSGENRAWPISTALVGLNGQLDSNGTPPGLHIIQDKIGEGMPAGTVFRSRKPTGKIWNATDGGDADENQPSNDDLILDRILTLAGMEEGLNRGRGCDSLERYIYIHGTNHEAEIGRPVSHGCIRMAGNHVVELFDLVGEGDPIVII